MNRDGASAATGTFTKCPEISGCSSPATIIARPAYFGELLSLSDREIIFSHTKDMFCQGVGCLKMAKFKITNVLRINT